MGNLRLQLRLANRHADATRAYREEKTDMKRIWIDTHIHVSDIGPDGEKRESMLEDLLELLDRCDADLRLIISCDGVYNSMVRNEPDGMLKANRMIHELVRQAPDRLYGSCIVNPNFLDESLKVMDLCFGEWGFVQLGEMLQYMMDFRMDSDASEEVVRRAVDYDVPVQVHLGTYCWPVRGYKSFDSADGIQHMTDLLAIVRRVPEAKYILAHAIGCGPTKEYIPWADMFLDVIQGSFDAYPENFWMEVRDFHCPALPRAVRDVPISRLLSGTDWTTRKGPPFQTYGTMFDVPEDENPFPPGVESFVGFLRDAGASDADIECIGSANAAELYGLNA
jgi:predicted TIM-barrel fold metal-dependent hydrolase